MNEVRETYASEYGIGLIVRASAELPVEERTGDHCLYTVELLPDDSFLANGKPMKWSWNGEIEKGVVVQALRALADEVENLGR